MPIELVANRATPRWPGGMQLRLTLLRCAPRGTCLLPARRSRQMAATVSGRSAQHCAWSRTHTRLRLRRRWCSGLPAAVSHRAELRAAW